MPCAEAMVQTLRVSAQADQTRREAAPHGRRRVIALGEAPGDNLNPPCFPISQMAYRRTAAELEDLFVRPPQSLHPLPAKLSPSLGLAVRERRPAPGRSAIPVVEHTARVRPRRGGGRNPTSDRHEGEARRAYFVYAVSAVRGTG